MRAAQLTSLCRLWRFRRAPAGPSAFVSAVPTPAPTAERGTPAPVDEVLAVIDRCTKMGSIGAGDVLH